MAYYVAKVLKIRPREILTTWGCEELLVCYGVYVNEQMRENYYEYEALPSDTKRTVKHKPTPYAIKFVTFDQLTNDDSPKILELEETVNGKLEQMMADFTSGGARLNGH